MWCMGEHIYGLYCCNAIVYIQVVQIASLGSRITRDINDALWSSTKDGLHYVRMHTGTGWVGDNNVRTSVLGNKVVGEDILHVTSIEQCIVNAVNPTVDFSILDSFRYIFYSNHLAGLTCNEIGDGTSAGIEVVNNLMTRQIGKLASDAVEVVCLFGICLIERLWTDFELQGLLIFS